jgi:hypothetical protein
LAGAIVSCLICLLLGHVQLYASQIHVLLDDPIYAYLDKCATQGLLPGFLNDTRPLTRTDLAKRLLELLGQREQLSGIDRQILDEYVADYRPELQKLQRNFQIPEGNQAYLFFSSTDNFRTGLHELFTYRDKREKQHLFIYEGEKDSVWIDWGEMVRLESKNGSYRPVTCDMIHFNAQLGPGFTVYFDGYRYVQFNTSDYTDLTTEYKGVYQAPGAETVSMKSFDYSNAYVQMTGNYGAFELGIEPIQWGNSPNSLILSNNVVPFPFFSWQKEFKRARFAFFHGSLMPKECEYDSTGEKFYERKYAVGHRWEMELTPKLNFAFTEVYIYGKRNMELAYLIPPVMLWPTQHNLMDRDNATIALEFEYFPWPGKKFYGILFLDEFTTTQIFNDYWANKQGVQLGLHYVPLKLNLPTDFRLEFTAVHPWTYTHKYFYNSYTNHGVDLGFYAGPNSQLWCFENQWWLGKKLLARIEYRQLKHGSVGDDSNLNYNERDPDYDHRTTWLMGEITTIEDYGLYLTYRWHKEIIFDGGLHLRKTDEATDNFLSFQIHFDY